MYLHNYVYVYYHKPTFSAHFSGWIPRHLSQHTLSSLFFFFFVTVFYLAGIRRTETDEQKNKINRRRHQFTQTQVALESVSSLLCLNFHDYLTSVNGIRTSEVTALTTLISNRIMFSNMFIICLFICKSSNSVLSVT